MGEHQAEALKLPAKDAVNDAISKSPPDGCGLQNVPISSDAVSVACVAPSARPGVLAPRRRAQLLQELHVELHAAVERRALLGAQQLGVHALVGLQQLLVLSAVQRNTHTLTIQASDLKK